MTGKSPAEGLYDLFVMGLMWLREDRPETLARRGASVFSAYGHANGVFGSAIRLAPQSWDLMELVHDQSVVYEGDKYPGVRDLRKWIAESDTHNVILKVPKRPETPELYFGASGFRHVITRAGIDYALGVAGEYSSVITAKKYLEGWAKHRRQITTFHAKHGKGGGARRRLASHRSAPAYYASSLCRGRLRVVGKPPCPVVTQRCVAAGLFL